jgi:hypothetical protein
VQHQLPTQAASSSWWAQARILTGKDTINEVIWKDSPRIHNLPGFTPSNLQNPGSLGAQQAMLDPAVTFGLGTLVLPWVPDLLGDEWTHQCGIVIVGQNYGQFVTGYTNRPRRMSAQAYATATTWQGFQARFTPDVVIDDDQYYEKLAPLLNTTNAKDRFVVTDLVRCTLVQRVAIRSGATTRIDNSIDLNDRKHRDAYAKYADLPESRDWLWERLTKTKARTIVALGRAPYCGLLRLFSSNACTVTDHKSGKPWRYRGTQWMYNCGIDSIERRLANGDWHDVTSATLHRSWAVILVTHPAMENNLYRTAVPVINAARQTARC